MILLDGKALAQEWRQGLRVRVEDFCSQNNSQPCLAVVIVGDDPASQVYVRNKVKA